MHEKKIKTYGLELIFLGVVAFISIILLTILAYKIFIKDQVKDSVEYKTAAFFVVNSDTLKEHLLTPMLSMEFDDVSVVEMGDYGICEITFNLFLEDSITDRLKVGLVKVSDFWVVYQAILSPDTPSEYLLVSTYQKILYFLQRLDYQDVSQAKVILEMIKKESRNLNLIEYLSARLAAVSGEHEVARQALDRLIKRVRYSKLAIMYERAMLDFTQRDYQTAIRIFLESIKELVHGMSEEEQLMRMRSLFRGLPKDPFIASFSHDIILADIYLRLSLAYYHTGEFEKGLDSAEQAIIKSNQISSRVVNSSALFVKALHLYELKRFFESDQAFSTVIRDLDNTNLTQKAWAYFYRAEIAAMQNRHTDSLDYYEMAVNLDPFNYPIRKGAIEYLISRNYVGDLEVALSLSLRGMDYEIEREIFKDFASLIYQRLGMHDKTRKMD